MRKANKLLSLLLTVVMLFQFMQTPISAVDYENNSETGIASEPITLPEEYVDGVKSEKKDNLSNIVAEDIQLREENIKHFRCEDGSYILADYGYPVHYFEDGEWKDIDNSLALQSSRDISAYSLYEDTDNGKFVNSQSNVAVELPQTLSEENELTLTKDGKTIRFGMVSTAQSQGSISDTNAAVPQMFNSFEEDLEQENETNYEDFLTLKNLTSSVIYSDVYPNTDIEYIVSPTGIKENIIIKLAQASYVYTYRIPYDGLTLTLQADGSVLAVDENQELVYKIEAPYMFDSEGEESASVQVSLTEDENGYLLTYTPDAAWINDPARQFPVTVDPSILVEIKKANIYDNYVCSKTPTQSYSTTGYMSLGNNLYGLDRSFVKLDLPALPHCSMINYASLNLIQKDYDPGSAGKQTVYACLYELGETNPANINETTEIGKITWNKQPTPWLNSNVIDYTEIKSKDYYTWNITSLAKKWYEDGENTGVAIKSSNENLSRKVTFYSSNCGASAGYPSLIVSYMNNIGLEGYWTYHSIDNGRSGMASINDYNGALVYVHDDISMNGNRLPINISHVYNMDKNDEYYYNGGYMSAGVGWRLNIRERIVELSNFPDTYGALLKAGYTIKYFDPDGTVKFFKSNAEGNYYEYDDKLKLKVAGSTNSAKRYAMSDETGNIKYFDYNGRLTGIKDSNGNEQTINYDTSGRISSVTDPVKRQVTFKYDGIMLTSITDPAGRVTSYEYTTINSQKYLAKIIYPDGKYTTFEYDANSNLTKVVGIDGAYSKFSYKEVALPGKTNFRITNAAFYGTQGNIQDSYTYTYSPSGTKVEDNFDHSETMLFDESGRTVCVTDENGRAFYGDYNKTGNKNNTLKYQSDMQQTITNLAKNSGAETGDEKEWYRNGLGNWDGNFRIDTTEKCHGLNSFKVFSANNARINYRQDLTIEPGKTYTLSAMVKTNGTFPENSGAFLGLIYQDASGNINYKKSELIRNTEGWERHSVTFTFPEDYTSLSGIMMGLDNIPLGIVWFDDVQLEEGAVGNRYNMFENGSMETSENGVPSGWLTENCGAGDSVTEGRSGNGYTITGAPDKIKSVYQNLSMNGKKGDTIVAGAWAKSNSVLATPEEKTDTTALPKDDKNCMLSVTVTYKEAPEGKNEKEVTDRFEFPSMSTDWQYISHAVTALGDYEKVKVALEYRYNMNTVTFDDADFYIDNYGAKYEYDDSGKITSEKDSAGQEYKYTYDGPDLTKVEFKKDGETKEESKFTYDDKHNLIKEVSDAGVITEYTYGENGVNTYGNVTKVTVKNADGTLQTSSTREYTSDYNYQTKITDARGNSSTYNYDTVKGLLEWTEDPDGNRISYVYDELTDVLLSTSGKTTNTGTSQTVANSYEYENDMLKSITHNGFKYNFAYDEFGRVTSTSVGKQVLSNNEYYADGKLKKSTYGNGDYKEPVYDVLDQVIAQKYNGVAKYEWEYGAKGQIGCYIDNVNNVSYRYEYDLADRLRVVSGSDGTRMRNLYDTKGNIYNTLYTFNNNSYIKAFSNNYIYGDDNRITQVHFNQNWIDINRDYDDLGRVTNRRYQFGQDAPLFKTDYIYLDGAEKNTTGLLASLNNNGNVLSYTYDKLGNISTISENNVEKLRYAYDELNQLIREDNAYAGKSYTYKYDIGGNIIEKKEYAYTTGTLGTVIKTTPYLYGDLNWKDKLTSYDGKTITYDEIGNPLTFDGNTFSWTGRQLDSISGNGKEISYKYNADGIRTEKTVNGKTTKYYLEGSRIVLEKDANEERTFWYDGDGKPAAFNIYSAATNGIAVNYYYIYNGQGDVIGLFDQTGAVVCRYYYDSWGKLLKITDGSGVDKTNDTNFIGYKNPIRYRGYYYDTETGLYYLNSRYYDPEIGRWINADHQIAGVGGEILGYNMFAYCMNNPVNMSDPTGNWPSWSNLIKGSAWLAVGITAVCVGVSVLTCGVAAPAMVAVAAVTVGAGALTAVNGAAEIGEAFTGCNVVRDTVFSGNQKAYNAYANTTAAIAEVGTAVCGGWLKTPSTQTKIADKTLKNVIDNPESVTKLSTNKFHKIANKSSWEFKPTQNNKGYRALKGDMSIRYNMNGTRFDDAHFGGSPYWVISSAKNGTIKMMMP